MTNSKKKTQSKKRKQWAEPDSNMTQMLKLSDREFKITLNNILRTIMEKTDKNTRDWQYN